MKIYLAGKFEQKEKVRELYERIKEQGYDIHSDWTTHKPISPYEENIEIAKQYSEEDINGVEICDVFILLTDPIKGTGSHVELGAAILSAIKFGRPKIYVIGEYNRESMFYFHPLVNRKKTIHEVLEDIKKCNTKL